ncbi:MAG: PilN domain-containing protein [Nitrospiraceae bacterium]|nr:PilN domain-containing protein [Nitrospiraceae bacterium]
MIKINLLPVKKKKKAKPLPTFLIVTVGVALLSIAVVAYLNYFFGSRVEQREATVSKNEQTLKDLEKKIKAVDDYEKRNADYKKRKDLIEQLGKNTAIPVRILDELSTVLPAGVWLTSLNIDGDNINMRCTAFSNTDVVNFVNNLKAAKLFSDVYLQESVQAQEGGFTIYNFGLTCKVKP